LIQDCLNLEPHARPTARGLAGELEAIHRDLSRPRRGVSFRRRTLSTAAAVLVAIGGLAGFAVERSHAKAKSDPSPIIDRETASTMLRQRASRAPPIGTPIGDPFLLGQNYAQRVVVADWIPVDPGLDHSLVVANARRGDSYLVRNGFLEMYESTYFAELGAPVEDEHADPAHLAVQRFEEGFLTWDENPWRGHASLVADLMLLRERAVAGTKFVREERHHDLFLTGYRAVGRCEGRAERAGPTTKGWLIVNPGADGAFAVCGAMLDRYMMTEPMSGRPTYETLGLPMRHEGRHDDRFEMRFENGSLFEKDGSVTLGFERHAER
jgi:hypothetical protein